MRSMKPKRKKRLAVIHAEGSDKFVLATAGGAVALFTPPSAPGKLNNSQISFWIDESGNQLKVSVKYSDGTVKNAAIPLT